MIAKSLKEVEITALAFCYVVVFFKKKPQQRGCNQFKFFLLNSLANLQLNFKCKCYFLIFLFIELRIFSKKGIDFQK